jgi:hypothetical protein
MRLDIVVDTNNRSYLTSKVNSLFLTSSRFKRVSEGINKKLTTKNSEESSSGNKRIEPLARSQILNLVLVMDLTEIIDFEMIYYPESIMKR